MKKILFVVAILLSMGLSSADDSSYSHFYDYAGLLSSPQDAELPLANLEQEKGIIIKMETVQSAGNLGTNYVNQKYNEYNLGGQYDMIIVYDVNSRLFYFKGICGNFNKAVRDIVLVNNKEALDNSWYDQAFVQIANEIYHYALENELTCGVYDTRTELPNVNGGSCAEQCTSGFGDCTLEKCVNIDGCIWSQNSCENICDQSKEKEIVVIKKDDDCANGKCDDLYLCENGKVPDGYPIEVASSQVQMRHDTVPADVPQSDTSSQDSLGLIGSCNGIAASFVDGYNSYSGTIKSAADTLRGRVDNPEALIAAMISLESGWKPGAKSYCGSVGLAQFIPSTARSYGLNVPPYNLEDCNINLCKRQVSACNSCTPNLCSPDDERLNPEKSVYALASYMSDLLDQCHDNLADSLLAYANGQCGLRSTINPNYDTTVLSYYSKWQSCLNEKIQSVPHTAIDDQYISQACTSSSSPDSQSGTCQYIDNLGCTFYTGRCPGSSNVKCCVLAFPSSTTVNGEPQDIQNAPFTGLQPGQYWLGEKVKIIESDNGFSYLDESGSELTPQCNIDPTSTGIRGYWLQLGTSCVGLHGVAVAEQSNECQKTIDNEKLATIFNNVDSGTAVTIKDPYEASATTEITVQVPETNIPATGNQNNNEELKQELLGTKTPLLSSGLRPEAATAFQAMKRAAQLDGVNLNIVSSYRTFEQQKTIWNRKFDSLTGTDAEKISNIIQYSAVPGLSRHHWGTEVDIDSVNPEDYGPNGNLEYVYNWLESNAARFGFCQPYKTDNVVNSEPWHWSYKPLSAQFVQQHMELISADDLIGKGIKGESEIVSNFDYYHKGFVSDINPDCLGIDDGNNQVSSPVTGATTAKSIAATSSACGGVCSWYGSGIANFLGLTNCAKRCTQLGCYWENDKCAASLSTCTLTKRNKINRVVILSGDGLETNFNKIIAKDDKIELFTLVQLDNGEWYTGPSEKLPDDLEIQITKIYAFFIDGERIFPKPLGYPATVKWYTVDPEIGHLSSYNANNKNDLLDAGCFEGSKNGLCEVCPDVGPDDQNYCWYQNLKRSPFWSGTADGIIYNQNYFGEGWAIDADTGVGTKRYRAEVTMNGITVSSPGAPDPTTPHKLKSKYYLQGITNDVLRVSRRSDFENTCPDPFKGSKGCKFMSYLDSYVNVPWIWGAYPNQRDNYIGFDCAELAVGAYSKMTGNVYGDLTAQGLATSSITKSVTGGRFWFDSNGNTRDRNGNSITIKIGTAENELHIGDLILLDYDSNNAYDHTTIFLGDENGNGVLDGRDKIETSCHWIKETSLSLQSAFSRFLSYCGLYKREVGNEKQLNLGSICSMDVRDEIAKKPNIAWIVRRFV